MGAHLLVCSIGNPAPYANSLHSAGHILLSALARSISYVFEKSSQGSLVSIGNEFILWQSGTYMNISGKAVAGAWKKYGGRLVVIHDEMELPLGRVKVSPGHMGTKGHNGLKSMLTKDYTRIGVGIGRPSSRDPEIVSAYVLRKMQGHERAKVEGCVDTVLAELRKMGSG